MNPRSAVAALRSRAARRVRAALSSSAVARWTRRASARATVVARQSRVSDVARWIERAVRASWLYRWLTADVEPDVVVIDLRETATLGPILALVDRSLAVLDRHWARSRSGAVATRVSDQFSARPVRSVSLVGLAAVLTNLLLLVLIGSPSPDAVGSRLVVLAFVLAGTQVTASATELADTTVYTFAVGVLAPPEPPERDDSEDSSE